MVAPLLCCQFAMGPAWLLVLLIVVYYVAPFVPLVLVIVAVVVALRRDARKQRGEDDGSGGVIAATARTREEAIEEARTAALRAPLVPGPAPRATWRESSSGRLRPTDAPDAGPRAPLPLVRRGWW
ncbi:MAG: hypothetical protein EOO75_08275 [Myxococcales bacterium]|nr:MAG: hypothetical protein EOO75_08275 [Myxococcales bacterium]